MTLTILIDKIANAIDKEEHIMGLFLDFWKKTDNKN